MLFLKSAYRKGVIADKRKYKESMISKEKRKQLGRMIDEAYADYGKKLAAYAAFKINNNGVSEDLVQDTFMKAWGYLVKGGEIKTMKSFLFHILNNLIVDQYRKHKTVSLDSLIENGYEPRARETGPSLDTIDGKEALLLIRRLPKTYKKVMYMRYRQDLSLEEMSRLTHDSKNNIAVKTHRGLEKLRLLYGSYA